MIILVKLETNLWLVDQKFSYENIRISVGISISSFSEYVIDISLIL